MEAENDVHINVNNVLVTKNYFFMKSKVTTLLILFEKVQ